jgi:hypothetical protein
MHGIDKSCGKHFVGKPEGWSDNIKMNPKEGMLGKCCIKLAQNSMPSRGALL